MRGSAGAWHTCLQQQLAPTTRLLVWSRLVRHGGNGYMYIKIQRIERKWRLGQFGASLVSHFWHLKLPASLYLGLLLR